MTGGCFARHRKTIERAVEAVCFRLVARRALNSEDAVDFKQEMLLHVLAHENILQSFAGRSTLTTYLFKVIERVGLRWCARRARQRRRLDLVGDLSAEIETSGDASKRVIAPSLSREDLKDDERWDLVLRSMARMRPPDRIVLDLMLAGKKGEEIATALSINRAAAYRRYERARDRLREIVLNEVNGADGAAWARRTEQKNRIAKRSRPACSAGR